MHAAYLIVTPVAAAFVGFSAWALFAHAGFIMEPLERLKIPRSWWPWLATAKALGAIGLVAGLFVPAIGVLAAICLVLYFAGAVVATHRQHRGARSDGHGHVCQPAQPTRNRVFLRRHPARAARGARRHRQRGSFPRQSGRPLD
jgi:hypothetical protein